MPSYQRRLTLAASQIFFIGGSRSRWNIASASSMLGASRNARASAIASSIANRVPEPIEKCTVRSASPISTVRPSWKRSFQITGKRRHVERLDSSGCPCRSGANTCSHNRRLAASGIVSKPASW